MRLTAGLPGPAGELTAIARPPASKGSRWSEKGRNEEMEGREREEREEKDGRGGRSEGQGIGLSFYETWLHY